MNISRRAFLLVLTVVFALSVCGKASAQDKNFTIVIDAGHGGRDPGAVSGRVLEKNLNLDITLALGKLIDETMSDVRVVYTRKDDSRVTLAERGRIANRAGADLFFSIHMNSNDVPSANGCETYVMGVHKNEESLEVAMRENEVMRYEDDRTEIFENFDPTSAESYIIFNLMQYVHFDRSLQLARIVQKHYAGNIPMRNRGAKQAGYAVLYGPAMPSVLTEVAFMSNESDRKYITSKAGQGKIVRSLYEAFREYKELVQSEGVVARPVEQPKPAPVKKSIEPFVDAAFYVQLLASRTALVPDDGRLVESGTKALERESGGWYRYYLGPFDNLNAAVSARDKAKKGSFGDAFVIPLDGTEQIGINEARRRIAAQK